MQGSGSDGVISLASADATMRLAADGSFMSGNFVTLRKSPLEPAIETSFGRSSPAGDGA
jgi:hypothetical protein